MRPELAGTLSLASPRAARQISRVRRALRWLLPGVLFALIPKCPLCLAAYLTLLTGLTVPVTIAATLRSALLATSVLAFAWLVFATWRHRRRAAS